MGPARRTGMQGSRGRPPARPLGRDDDRRPDPAELGFAGAGPAATLALQRLAGNRAVAQRLTALQREDDAEKRTADAKVNLGSVQVSGKAEAGAGDDFKLVLSSDLLSQVRAVTLGPSLDFSHKGPGTGKTSIKGLVLKLGDKTWPALLSGSLSPDGTIDLSAKSSLDLGPLSLGGDVGLKGGKATAGGKLSLKHVVEGATVTGSLSARTTADSAPTFSGTAGLSHPKLPVVMKLKLDVKEHKLPAGAGSRQGVEVVLFLSVPLGK